MTGMRVDGALGPPRKPFIPKYPSSRINNQNQKSHWQTRTRARAQAQVRRWGGKRTEVSNKLAGSVREGEGISPEKPLEGDNADTHHGYVHHAECVLSAQQS